MLEKIKKFLLYAGNSGADSDLAMPKILNYNRTTVAVISCCATILISGMFVSTFFVKGVESNRIVYAIGAIMVMIVFILSSTYAKKYTWLTMPLVHVSNFVFYIYGILIGTITDPTQKTVSFIVMLVFLPVIFIERPIHTIASSVAYSCVFILLCFQNKTDAVLQNDVIDAITFGILGIISGAIVNGTKIYGYALEQKLQEVSRFDQLTQMNNRNSYELQLKEIPSHAKCILACIYVDVNGLHELNNIKGHACGDEMLKFVADQIKMFFGDDLSFRVGGDEFVIFVPDIDGAKLAEDLTEMVANIEIENYHIAVGFEVMGVHHLSMEALIRSAEIKMYKSKKQFYKNRANDRRHD